jgi:pyruvate/2-oxoglutarate dehydrogenase complex dihydrolipoamide acyltransferase (E2) component
MQAFRNDPKIKAKYLRRVRAHAKADEIIHGKYWEGGRGCAVGCTIHSGNHQAYEDELGIPKALAHLEDTLFEGQHNGDAKQFPARFISAIRVGADLSKVQFQFLHWLLTEELAVRDDPAVMAIVKECADVLEPATRGLPIDLNRARNAAAAAAAGAAEAVWAAAAAAAAAEAVWAAEAASRAAAAMTWVARAAAAAAAGAAEAVWVEAVWAAGAAGAAEAVWAAAAAAAAAAACKRMADKLIELLSKE